MSDTAYDNREGEKVTGRGVGGHVGTVLTLCTQACACFLSAGAVRGENEGMGDERAT